MYYKYCKQCGRPSNGYPLCKRCYYQQQNEGYNNNQYESDTRININLGAIVQGIATIVQCFKAPQTLPQQQPEAQKVIEQQNANNQTVHKQRKWKTAKGFYVKSQQERTISDFLTENGIYHVYEKRFDIGGGDYLLPDFYIKGPVMFNGKILEDIYIEHWGMEDNKAYNIKTKEKKIPAYRQAGITLINTYPEDIIDYRENLTHKLTYYKEHQINYYKDL